MKLLYIDCFAGIAGDMMLAALFDLDPGLEAIVRDALARLPLSGYRLVVDHLHRAGITARKVTVEVDEQEQPARSLREILAILDEAELTEGARSRAREMFEAIGRAEGAIHGVPPEKVHFHEVGAVDSIVDILGVAVALDHLDALVRCARVPLGSGFVRCQHGTLPVPAPATLALLEGVPVEGTEIPYELVTPTGAAIVRTQATSFGPMPPMIPRALGWGAGTRNHPDRPGLLRLVLGEVDASIGRGSCVVLEANVDDMTAELAAHAIERALSEGALDAWATPITMKKGRPALQIGLLARQVDRDRLARLILEETTSIGLRFHDVGRIELARRTVEVETAYGRLPVKVAGEDDRPINVAPEFDACRRAARDHGVPLKQVMATAMAAALAFFERR